MILTDREIQVFLENRQIRITPNPPAERYSSTSVDLALLGQVRVWNLDQIDRSAGEIIEPGAGFKYTDFRAKYTKLVRLDEKGYVIGPGQFILAWTVENLSLPNSSRVAARVEGKSSLARLGLGVHVTAPIIHAGFEGRLQLEMYNHGPVSIRLRPGMAICQVVFELSFGTPEKGYRGQFWRQRT